MDKRQELLDACRSAQLVVEAAIQEDGQWTDDGKNLVYVRPLFYPFIDLEAN
jgi:hypothetical protein